MQMVIAGKDPDVIERYLVESGHKVKSFYVNNICLSIARAYNPEIFIYMEDVIDKIPHEQALKLLQSYRVMIIASRNNPIIPYAAALGIKDYVFQPCELSEILNRIENPATSEEAAELLHVQLPSNNRLIANKVDVLKPHIEHRKVSSKKSKSTKTGLQIVDTEMIDLIKKGVVVDAEGRLSQDLELKRPDLWKADWRLGIDARPYALGNLHLYAQTRIIGAIDERDQLLFLEFIESLLEKQKTVYVIDSGRWREELLRMGAFIMEGGI